MHQGSCLCGSIKFEFEDAVGDYVLCHCQSCRKASGSAFGANISVPIESFKLLTGQDSLKVFESTPGKRRHFCHQCGSPIFTKVGDASKYVRVRLGSLDTPFSPKPKAHIFVGHKAAWDSPASDIASYDLWPAPDKANIAGSHQPKSPR